MTELIETKASAFLSNQKNIFNAIFSGLDLFPSEIQSCEAKATDYVINIISRDPDGIEVHASIKTETTDVIIPWLKESNPDDTNIVESSPRNSPNIDDDKSSESDTPVKSPKRSRFADITPNQDLINTNNNVASFSPINPPSRDNSRDEFGLSLSSLPESILSLDFSIIQMLTQDESGEKIKMILNPDGSINEHKVELLKSGNLDIKKSNKKSSRFSSNNESPSLKSNLSYASNQNSSFADSQLNSSISFRTDSKNKNLPQNTRFSPLGGHQNNFNLGIDEKKQDGGDFYDFEQPFHNSSFNHPEQFQNQPSNLFAKDYVPRNNNIQANMLSPRNDQKSGNMMPGPPDHFQNMNYNPRFNMPRGEPPNNFNRGHMMPGPPDHFQNMNYNPRSNMPRGEPDNFQNMNYNPRSNMPRGEPPPNNTNRGHMMPGPSQRKTRKFS